MFILDFYLCCCCCLKKPEEEQDNYLLYELDILEEEFRKYKELRKKKTERLLLGKKGKGSEKLKGRTV